MARGDAGERTLRAAARVMVRDGADAMTLEAVAAEAGVSKGGLLYHFPSKEALISALIDDWLERFDRSVAARAAADSGAWASAYVQATADRRDSEPDRTLDGALLIAMAADRKRLAALQPSYKEWQRRLEGDVGDKLTATLVRLATDGLWLADVLDLAPPRGRLRRELVERLRYLAGNADSRL
jgi:AcrR family transcriptional regulator